MNDMPVIPANAGIPLLPFLRFRQGSGGPAFAGLTERR